MNTTGKTKNINIPYKCLLPLVSNPELLKAYIIYGRLKLKFTYSSIHNIKSRKKELAKSIGISENTFRKYLSILKTNKLAWEDKSGCLRLSGRYSIYSLLNIIPTYSSSKERISDRWYKLYENQLNKEEIQLLALVHKREQINYKNTIRIKNQLLKSFGNIKCPKTKRKIESNCIRTAKRIIEDKKVNFAEGFKNDSKYGMVDDNLSGTSIAKIIGRKSRITGNRLMHKLKAKGKISYTERLIEIKRISEHINLLIVSETNMLPATLSTKKGIVSLCLRVPNKWTLI